MAYLAYIYTSHNVHKEAHDMFTLQASCILMFQMEVNFPDIAWIEYLFCGTTLTSYINHMLLRNTFFKKKIW